MYSLYIYISDRQEDCSDGAVMVSVKGLSAAKSLCPISNNRSRDILGMDTVNQLLLALVYTVEKDNMR